MIAALPIVGGFVKAADSADVSQPELAGVEYIFVVSKKWYLEMLNRWDESNPGYPRSVGDWMQYLESHFFLPESFKNCKCNLPDRCLIDDGGVMQIVFAGEVDIDYGWRESDYVGKSFHEYRLIDAFRHERSGMTINRPFCYIFGTRRQTCIVLKDVEFKRC